MEIEVVHPITHNGMEYGRGLHTVTKETGELFLSFTDMAGEPLNVARMPNGTTRGAVTVAADAADAEEDSKLPANGLRRTKGK